MQSTIRDDILLKPAASDLPTVYGSLHPSTTQEPCLPTIEATEEGIRRRWRGNEGNTSSVNPATPPTTTLLDKFSTALANGTITNGRDARDFLFKSVVDSGNDVYLTILTCPGVYEYLLSRSTVCKDCSSNAKSRGTAGSSSRKPTDQGTQVSFEENASRPGAKGRQQLGIPYVNSIFGDGLASLSIAEDDHMTLQENFRIAMAFKHMYRRKRVQELIFCLSPTFRKQHRTFYDEFLIPQGMQLSSRLDHNKLEAKIWSMIGVKFRKINSHEDIVDFAEKVDAQFSDFWNEPLNKADADVLKPMFSDMALWTDKNGIYYSHILVENSMKLQLRELPDEHWASYKNSPRMNAELRSLSKAPAAFARMIDAYVKLFS